MRKTSASMLCCVVAVGLVACSASLDSGGEDGDGGATPGEGGAGGTQRRAGSGGAAGGGGAAPAGSGGSMTVVADGGVVTTPPPAGVKVLLSEVMYHPVLEDSEFDRHEFVELFNRSKDPVAMKGWQLQGDVQYAFGDVTLAAGQHVVVARDRKALLAVAYQGLTEAGVVGDYAGELDNGRGRVQLVDDKGAVVDDLSWRDQFPWSAGPDALGASERFLAPALLPLATHRRKGHSLERASFEAPTQEPSTWVPSVLDQPTPGRPNGALARGPLAIAIDLKVLPQGSPEGPVRPENRAVVRATFSGQKLTAPAVEFFADDLARTDEKPTRVAMMPTGQPSGFEAVLPAHPDNTIVRYRIVGDRGMGPDEVISPHASDPFRFHAFFVGPEVKTESPDTRLYQIFIAPDSWSKMWTNVGPANNGSGTTFVSGCEPNPNWDATVPAVLVYRGQVYDVQTRHNGSRFHRRTGAGGQPDAYKLKTFPWTAPGPTYPNPMQALGWNIKLPRYRTLEGKQSFKLNKLLQSCPGVTSALAGRLYGAVGVPASQPRFARVHINGAYYHYSMEHDGNEEIFRNVFKTGKLGDVYKAKGTDVELGPFQRADGRLLVDHPGCPKWKAEQRYAINYNLKTNEWKGAGDVPKLLTDLDVARRAGPDAIRTFLSATFDMARLHSYLAVRRWSAGADDAHQNYFLYRGRDGKWLLAPWDVDREFGSWKPATASFYIGEQGNPHSLGADWWNRLQDAYFKAFRPEFQARLHELSKTLLAPDTVRAQVDESMAAYDKKEALASPVGAGSCDVDRWVNAVKKFAGDRDGELKKQIPAM